ncbi:MAG: ion transporter [Clostridia bacterium]|nr:ion transporter [Clostridia bacterium]
MSKYKQIKKRIYEIIGPAAKGDKLSYAVDIIICLLVLLSSVAVIVELIGVPEKVASAIETFEYITVGIFAFEYVLRLWTAELAYPECKNKLEALKEYVTSFDSLIDVLSIVSIVFNQIPKQLAFLRLVKLVKLARLVKLSEHVKTSDKVHEKSEMIKKRVNEIIDKGKEGDKVSKIYDITSIVLILLSVSFILVETFPISPKVHLFLYVFEVAIASFFAVEYVLRVWTAPMEFPFLRPDKARMRYIFSFMSLVDLLSIVPVFVANLPTATGVMKIFKLCKILRLVKASRYLSGIANFGKAIQAKKRQIALSIIAICVMIVICSVLMYSFENKEQPDVFNNGFSGIYYSFQVLMGGEGDIQPVTAIGQGLATLMLLLGGCMFGVPIAIVSTGFEDMIAEQAGEEEESTDVYELLKQYDSLSSEEKKHFRAYVSVDENKKG